MCMDIRAPCAHVCSMGPWPVFSPLTGRGPMLLRLRLCRVGIVLAEVSLNAPAPLQAIRIGGKQSTGIASEAYPSDRRDHPRSTESSAVGG